MKKSIFVFLLLSLVTFSTGCASPQAQKTFGDITTGLAAGLNAVKYLGAFRCESCHSSTVISSDSPLSDQIH